MGGYNRREVGRCSSVPFKLHLALKDQNSNLNSVLNRSPHIDFTWTNVWLCNVDALSYIIGLRLELTETCRLILGLDSVRDLKMYKALDNTRICTRIDSTGIKYTDRRYRVRSYAQFCAAYSRTFYLFTSIAICSSVGPTHAYVCLYSFLSLCLLITVNQWVHDLSIYC